MKTWEALSMLCAARDGKIPDKEEASKKYGKRSKKILKNIGMKDSEINGEYPDKELNYGLFLITNHPMFFAKQAKAAAAWLICRN